MFTLTTVLHNCVIFVSGHRELTDGLIIKLSKRFNSPEELENLAVIGLELDEDVVAGHLRNYSGDIHSAAKAVFKEWRMRQDNRKIAFNKMCTALKHRDVGQNSLVHEILQA